MLRQGPGIAASEASFRWRRQPDGRQAIQLEASLQSHPWCFWNNLCREILLKREKIPCPGRMRTRSGGAKYTHPTGGKLNVRCGRCGIAVHYGSAAFKGRAAIAAFEARDIEVDAHCPAVASQVTGGQGFLLHGCLAHQMSARTKTRAGFGFWVSRVRRCLYDQAAAGNFDGRIRLSAGMPNFSCRRQIILSVRGRLRARIS